MKGLILKTGKTIKQYDKANMLKIDKLNVDDADSLIKKLGREVTLL